VALAAAIALQLGAVTGAVAEARPTVKAELYQARGKQRLIVTVAEKRPFTNRNRPRSVTIRYRRASYRLRNVTPRPRPRRRRVSATFWQNRSSAARSVGRLAEKSVLVIVRTAAGTARFRRTVAPPPVIFEPPPRTVRGEEAWRHVKQYFVNSRFTDCPEGWPRCDIERQVNHCAGGDMTGGWQRRDFPPTLTSDVSGSYRITDVWTSSAGSWGLTYVVTLPSGTTGTFVWAVLPDGRASGAYELGDEFGALAGFRWRPSAGC
jgi:hypothetical protein